MGEIQQEMAEDGVAGVWRSGCLPDLGEDFGALMLGRQGAGIRIRITIWGSRFLL